MSKGAPVNKRLGGLYDLHYRLPEIRIQDFFVCKFMQNDERAAFQQVDVPNILVSFRTICPPDNPLVVLSETLGRSLQFIISPKNVVPLPCLGGRLCRAKVLDKPWGVDDSTETRRVTLDV